MASMFRHIVLLLALLLAACTAGRQEQAVRETVNLSSPDGTLSMEFRLLEDGTPQYALTRGDIPVVLPSRLGFDLR